MTHTEEEYNWLDQKIILTVFDRVPVTPISDSWFGEGYTLHLGTCEAPMLMSVFPQGRFVQIKALRARLELGDIGLVIPSSSGVRMFSGEGEGEILLEVSRDGQWRIQRNPKADAAELESPRPDHL